MSEISKEGEESAVRKRSSVGAFLSLLFLQPHLNVARKRQERRDLLRSTSLWMFLCATVLALCFAFLPFAGGEGQTLSLYDLFHAENLTRIGYVKSAKPWVALSYLTVIFAAVSLLLAVAALFCDRRKIGKGSLLIVAGYLFGALTLGFAAAFRVGFGAYLGSTLMLVLTCVLLFLLVALSALGFYFVKASQLRAYEGENEKLMKRASCVDSISAKGIRLFRTVLHHTPVILFSLICIAALVLMFLPVCRYTVEGGTANGSMGNLFAFLKDVCSAKGECATLISVFKDSQQNVPAALERYSEVASSLAGSYITLAVFLFLSAAAAVAGVVLHFSKLRFRGKKFLTALPYVFAALLFIVSVTMYQNIAEDAVQLLQASDAFHAEQEGLSQAGKITAEAGGAFTSLMWLGTLCNGLCALLCLVGYGVARFLDDSFDYLFLGEKETGYMGTPAHFHILSGERCVADNAFEDCHTLTSLICADTVTSIGKSAFENCSALGRAIVGRSVKEIGDYAFVGCTSLEEIVLPETLERIGEYAFFGCERLKCIVFEGTTDEWGRLVKGMDFDGETGRYCVRCRDGLLVAGEAAC